jgi:hypothetical protein
MRLSEYGVRRDGVLLFTGTSRQGCLRATVAAAIHLSQDLRPRQAQYGCRESAEGRPSREVELAIARMQDTKPAMNDTCQYTAT